MKCYYHENRDAVATCTMCNKGLCKECASLNNPCLCSECVEIAKKDAINYSEEKRKNALIDTTTEFIFAIVKGIIAVVAGYFIVKYILGAKTISLSDMWFLFFLPFGWSVFTYLEQFFSSVFLGGFLFLIYLALKFIASVFLGIPCFIYQIIKFIIGVVSNRK